MKVFVSWSQKSGHDLALALRDWLPEVIQQVEPWVSSEDIEKGKRWSAEISQSLDSTSQGIVCVTKDNLNEPWLNFEAGALAKSIETAQVRTVLLDLQPRDVTGPLAEFQATKATDREDMFKLAESLNSSCVPPLPQERLSKAFDRAWDEIKNRLDGLAERLNDSAATKGDVVPPRPNEDMLGEILERVRGIERVIARPAPTSKRSSVTFGEMQEQHAISFIYSFLTVSPDKILMAHPTVTLEYAAERAPKLSTREMEALRSELERIAGLSSICCAPR